VMVMGNGTAVALLLTNHHPHDDHRRPSNDGEQRRPAKNWPATTLVGTMMPFMPQLRRRTMTTTMMMTSCEGVVDATAAAVLDSDAKDDDDATTTTTTNTIAWETMNVPNRATVSSHAIIGTLLNDDRIERYDVYRRVSLSTTTLPSTSMDKTEEEDEDRLSNHNTAVRAMVRFGGKLNGHPGIVHGGILALLIDDILGFGFVAANVKMAVTANLNIDYRAPVPAGTTIVVDAVLDEQRRNDAPRKLYWNVTVTDATDPSLVYCHATSLFIIPRQHHHHQQM
jgi:acyl-coenzyme A thioesterase PaaI-like protein